MITEAQLAEIEGYFKPMLYSCPKCDYCGEREWHPGCGTKAVLLKRFDAVLGLISDVRQEREALKHISLLCSEGPLFVLENLGRVQREIAELNIEGV